MLLELFRLKRELPHGQTKSRLSDVRIRVNGWRARFRGRPIGGKFALRRRFDCGVGKGMTTEGNANQIIVGKGPLNRLRQSRAEYVGGWLRSRKENGLAERRAQTSHENFVLVADD